MFLTSEPDNGVDEKNDKSQTTWMEKKIKVIYR
jgi:hypothetical protein